MSAAGPVKRVTLWVRDADASLRLYRDALGMAVLEDKEISGAAIGRMIGQQEATLRIVHLGTPGSTHGWVGLYELRNARPGPAPALPKPENFPCLGQATIVVTTDRMSDIVPRLRALGVRFLTEPTEYVKSTPGEATPPGRYSEAIFFDPDGIPVSLMGYTPL
jgi:catechol 2,3-dioxygenase-like lactoylglutathione lyase family enzyme